MAAARTFPRGRLKNRTARTTAAITNRPAAEPRPIQSFFLDRLVPGDSGGRACSSSGSVRTGDCSGACARGTPQDVHWIAASSFRAPQLGQVFMFCHLSSKYGKNAQIFFLFIIQNFTTTVNPEVDHKGGKFPAGFSYESFKICRYYPSQNWKEEFL